MGCTVRRVLIPGLILCALLGWGTLAAPASATAASPAGLHFTVKVGGRNLDEVDAGSPLRLDPGRALDVDVTLTNSGTAPIAVRDVKIESRVLGLAFITYSTEVDLLAKPGGSDRRQYAVDLIDLQNQATGLLPAEVELYDNQGNVVASESFVIDVRGSLFFSVYGRFGLTVLAITLLLLGTALWRLRQGRLPENRWRRAMTFAVAGLGIGLVLTFSFSALRWLVPHAAIWTTLVLAGAAVGFVAGYLTPTPGEDEPGTDLESGSTGPHGRHHGTVVPDRTELEQAPGEQQGDDDEYGSEDPDEQTIIVAHRSDLSHDTDLDLPGDWSELPADPGTERNR